MNIHLVVVKREDVKRMLDYDIKHNLISFEFLKKDDFLWKNDETLYLDSGAFTFLKKGQLNNLDSHLKNYIDYIKKNDIKKFFELDLYNIIGIDKTEDIRKKIEDSTGKATIPVWHKSLGIEYYKELCKNYDHIAIGGFAIKNITKKDFLYLLPLLNIAKELNCKVHGLGFTSTIELKKYKFFSVDSSTWDVYRFGELQYYDYNTNTIKRIKDKRRIKKEKRNELLNNNVKIWKIFSDYANKNL